MEPSSVMASSVRTFVKEKPKHHIASLKTWKKNNSRFFSSLVLHYTCTFANPEQNLTIYNYTYKDIFTTFWQYSSSINSQ